MSEHSKVQLERAIEAISGMIGAVRHDLLRGNAKGVEADLKCLALYAADAKTHYDQLFPKGGPSLKATS